LEVWKLIAKNAKEALGNAVLCTKVGGKKSTLPQIISDVIVLILM
jgi:hypothetical protein